MSELIIIVTRMKGVEGDEFMGWFKISNIWFKAYPSQSSSNEGTLEYNNNLRVVYVNGKVIKNKNERCKEFQNFLGSIKDRKILMLIHPGTGSTIENAKQRILGCGTNTVSANYSNVSFVEYSSTMKDIYIKVEKLAFAIRKPSGNIEGCIKDIIDIFNQKKNVNILHLFLPLDIDMQALEILAEKKKKGEKVKDPAEYLQKMYADNIGYSEKLLDLQQKTKELQVSNKSLLDKLCGITNENVCKFFEVLDRKESGINHILHHDWGIDKITSFHDWYCALATCLRGERACNKNNDKEVRNR